MDKHTNCPGKGLISNTGGDKQAYLGHFRSAKNMERGHNFGFGDVLGAAKKVGSFGMSGGGDGGKEKHRPSKKQLGNEAWRGSHKVASAKADVRAAKKSGDEGAVQAAKAVKHDVVGEKKDALKTVRGAAKAVQESKGLGGGTQRTAKAALQTARATAKEGFKGALAKQDMKRAAKKKGKSGGMFSKMTGGIL